jgi:mono/diheme cytochrome c family protein
MSPKNKSTFIFIAGMLAVLAILVTACAPAATPTPAMEIPKPSNPGGPGEAVNLTGNATAGVAVFKEKCVECHGEEGKVGIANPGSTDGTVPSLNPIDEGLIDKDLKVYAQNLDLFLEHGSTPEGDNPVKKMTAFGDNKELTPQQIADVIAYVISLNKK